MPRTTKTGRRRVARKPTMKKAKQMVTKLHKKKAKKNMDTFFLRAKVQDTLVPSQGVLVANYLYRHLPLMDAASPLSVTNIPEFNLYRVQYDKVRINSVHIVVTPKANVLDVAAAQNDAAYMVNGDGLIHTVIDRDSGAPSNIAALERYPSYRAYSQRKKFSRSYGITWTPGIWLDCQNIYQDTTLLNRMGCFGGITLYGENFMEDQLEITNEPWAKVEVYYNCVFQGKTSASLTVSDDGSITLRPHELFTNLAQTPLGSGTGGGPTGRVVTYDNSGNQVIMGDRGDHS